MSAITSALERAFAHPWHPLLYDLIALLVVVLFAWRGCRRGVVRELSSLASILGSAILAKPFGTLLLPILPLGSVPPFLHKFAALTVGGLLAYPLLRIIFSLAASFAGLLREREGRAALVMQASGAFVGGFFGVGITFILGWYVLSMGQLTDFLLRLPPETEAAASGEAGSRDDLLLLPAKLAAVHWQGLAYSAFGGLAETTNPVPEQTIDGIEILLETVQDPAGLQRIAKFAPVQKLMAQDSVRELATNPEIRELAANGDLVAIINHAAFQKVAEDPAVQEALQDVDFTEVIAFLEGEEEGAAEEEPPEDAEE